MQISMSAKKALRNFIIRILNLAPIYIISRVCHFNWFRKRYKIDFEKTFDIYFPPNRGFKFIQVGGNDGLSFDSLFEKIVERVSNGIILEPSPKYFEKLKINYSKYPNIILLNKAIHPIELKVTLYEANNTGLAKLPDWGQGIGSFNFDHLKSKNLDPSDISMVDVDCISFNNLIRQFPAFEEIDFLQVDTEGFDGEILKSIDFSMFGARVIKFEHCHLLESELVEVKGILYANSFLVIDDAYNSIAIKSPKAVFFK